jgi:hypothetical protein
MNSAVADVVLGHHEATGTGRRIHDRAADPMTVPVWLSQRSRPIGLGLGATGLAILVLSAIGYRSQADYGYDFLAYLDAAERVLATGSPYQPETIDGPFQPGPGGLYLYPPPLAASLIPLTPLDRMFAIDVWLVGRLVALVVACALMPVATWIRGAALLGASVCLAIRLDLAIGNVSLLLLLPMVIAWRWPAKWPGGLALASMILVRPTFGVVLVDRLARARFRVVLHTVLIALGIAIATLVVVSPVAYPEYVRVLGNLTGLAGIPRNADLASLGLRLGLSPAVSQAMQLLGYGLAIGAMLIALRRDAEGGLIVAFCATLLLSPLLWVHYLAVLVVTGAFVAGRGWWPALAMPLLAWAPEALLPFVAMAAIAVPLLASRPGGESGIRVVERSRSPAPQQQVPPPAAPA